MSIAEVASILTGVMVTLLLAVFYQVNVRLKNVEMKLGIYDSVFVRQRECNLQHKRIAEHVDAVVAPLDKKLTKLCNGGGAIETMSKRIGKVEQQVAVLNDKKQ